MKRKLVLALILCAAAVVLLSAGATTAAAATCTDCHAGPDGPPAPHGVWVAAVTDCTTCHVGMSPHPTTIRTTRLTLGGKSSDAGYVLRGKVGRLMRFGLGTAYIGFPDVTVYLQQRLWGATDYTDLATTTTGSGDASGTFTYTVATPAAFATYRVIASGVTGLAAPSDGTWWPTRVVLLPKPKLTLKLAGLTDGVLRPGAALKASGTVAPAGLTAEKVKLVVMRSRAGQWVLAKTAWCEITATDTYNWTYKPAVAGTYKIQAMIAKTDTHLGLKLPWMRFKVK